MREDTLSNKNAAKSSSHQPAQSSSDASRRQFLQMGVGGAVAGIITSAGVELLNPSPSNAQSKLSPDESLKELMDGNARFVSGNLTSGGRGVQAARAKTVNKQEPFASVLACADSRVPVEYVFDQNVGDIFVTRVAGNIATPEIIGSIEYGVAVLGTKVILVMGHHSCGAVKAAIEGKAVPGQISSLFPHLQAAVDKSGPDAEAVAKTNAIMQAALLRESSSVVSEAVKAGNVKVVAGYYDLASGAVTILS